MCVLAQEYLENVTTMCKESYGENELKEVRSMNHGCNGQVSQLHETKRG